jgi:hypothetical protein
MSARCQWEGMPEVLWREVSRWPDATQVFWSLLWDHAHAGSSVGPVFRALGWKYSTITSLCRRAGLPSPKRVLVAFRLILAAREAGRHATVADLAEVMGAASATALTRHLRQVLGVTGHDFLVSAREEQLVDWALEMVVLPYRDAWCRLALPPLPLTMDAVRPLRAVSRASSAGTRPPTRVTPSAGQGRRKEGVPTAGLLGQPDAIVRRRFQGRTFVTTRWLINGG